MGLRQQEVKNSACRKFFEWRDPGPRGLWARSPGALEGLGPSPKPPLSNYDFSQTSWWEPGEGVGVG